jgi:hypothetical protein
MNERIRELAEQATDTVEIVNPDTGITHHREFFDKEKFAQLIVRECLSNMEDCGGDLDFAIWKTKKDFGVEE